MLHTGSNVGGVVVLGAATTIGLLCKKKSVTLQT